MAWIKITCIYCSLTKEENIFVALPCVVHCYIKCTEMKRPVLTNSQILLAHYRQTVALCTTSSLWKQQQDKDNHKELCFHWSNSEEWHSLFNQLERKNIYFIACHFYNMKNWFCQGFKYFLLRPGNFKWQFW